MQIEKLGSVMVSVPAGEGVEDGLRFYGETLGLDLRLRDGDRYAALACPGANLALAAPGEHPEDAALALALKVDDLDAWHAHLRARDVTVGEIEVGGHERRFAALDPFGNSVVLYAPL